MPSDDELFWKHRFQEANARAEAAEKRLAEAKTLITELIAVAEHPDAKDSSLYVGTIACAREWLKGGNNASN